MSLSELPAAVLDAVVECSGFDQGWRLEVVSTSLQATSMECCVARLGKCRWTAGDRAGTEFKPCWRHVAVALRRGTREPPRRAAGGSAAQDVIASTRHAAADWLAGATTARRCRGEDVVGLASASRATAWGRSRSSTFVPRRGLDARPVCWRRASGIGRRFDARRS